MIGCPSSRRRISNASRVAATPYLERHLKPAGIRSHDTAGHCNVLKKTYVRTLPLKALEDRDVVNPFKTDSEYARNVEAATLHEVLAILCAAIRSVRHRHHLSSISFFIGSASG
jgi:hypothetical protein